MRRKMLLVALAIVTTAAGFEFEGLFPGGLDHPAIEYATRPVHNVVSELNLKIQRGEVHLTFHGASGYLRSSLEQLHIPVESQMVVFSKTSLQQELINPRNPRAIYFNDSAAAAWVKGEPFVELAVEDPEQGVIFYTLDQKPRDKPQFVRQDGCLQCHESYSSLGVPGMLLRSVFPSSNGTVERQLGNYVSDHRSPFEERWGGWYVSGAGASLGHMGNATFDTSGFTAKHSEKSSLKSEFDTSDYLSPYSDIVALMVFTHQMHMVNLLTRAGWEARLALYQRGTSADQTLRHAASELADYLLFVDEAPLPAKIQGPSGFAEQFAAGGPHDQQGRSLKQFDLTQRLMRYPCSYMIYSAAFDHLPKELKEGVYQRLWNILTGRVPGPRYDRLSPADRSAVIEILGETKTDLPGFWRMPE